jgi:hypothetical protein
VVADGVKMPQRREGGQFRQHEMIGILHPQIHGGRLQCDRGSAVQLSVRGWKFADLILEIPVQSFNLKSMHPVSKSHN